MQGLVEFIRTLGAPRIAAMVAVTLALVGFFAFLIMRVTAPQMSPLFTGLPYDDTAAIVKDLDRQGVQYELRDDGAVVLVPKDMVAKLRMKLAEGGLPKGGGVGYEIFDKSDALGATSFIQNINKTRALEGELARTIRSLDRVQGARVHLVLPDRPLFSRDKIEASASIVLQVRGRLEAQQVTAIRHLVATAVTGLKPERVSIVDETGRLLADGAGNNGDATVVASERQTSYENRLRAQIESIVSSVVGPGRARVELTADFDFNRTTQTSERFDPDGRVVRSSQSREESSGSTQNRDSGVSVSNELPGAGPNGSANGRDQNKKTEEVLNYEVSHTTKTEVSEGGRINKISVAVLVDGSYTKGAKGEQTYQPRSKEEIDRIASLVRTAIGFDQKRGDQVEVVNLRFAEAPVPFVDEPSGWWTMFQFTKEDVMHAAEEGALALLGLMMILFVVRPLMRRAIAPEAPRISDAAALASALAGGNLPAAIAAGATVDDIKAVPSATAKMIDIAQVQGQVHAQSVQKVGELAERNPNETISIIRTWLHEGAA